MIIPYDMFISSFNNKITDYDLAFMADMERNETVDGYMKRAIIEFSNICKYDLVSGQDDDGRVIEISQEIDAEDHLYDIIDIISDGMIVQWLKPYIFNQELFENTVSTRDFSLHSPAELLLRIGNAYQGAKKDYKNRIKDYSYDHGDISSLHI